MDFLGGSGLPFHGDGFDPYEEYGPAFTGGVDGCWVHPRTRAKSS